MVARLHRQMDWFDERTDQLFKKTQSLYDLSENVQFPDNLTIKELLNRIKDMDFNGIISMDSVKKLGRPASIHFLAPASACFLITGSKKAIFRRLPDLNRVFGPTGKDQELPGLWDTMSTWMRYLSRWLVVSVSLSTWKWTHQWATPLISHELPIIWIFKEGSHESLSTLVGLPRWQAVAMIAFSVTAHLECHVQIIYIILVVLLTGKL